MLRILLIPALAVGALFYVVVGYGGYLLLRPVTAAQSQIEHAWAGDVSAQKHVAGCYTQGGCPDMTAAPVLGCAWRQVILEETREADARLEAEAACGRIDPALSSVVAEAKREVQSRIKRSRLAARMTVAQAKQPSIP